MSETRDRQVMHVHIEVPEDVSKAMEARWGDLPLKALECLAIEGYRSGVLTESQIRRMLGYESRIEVHRLMHSAGVPLDYGIDDLNDDIESHRRVGILPPA